MLLQVKTFLYCIDLKPASLIIGYLNLILNLTFTSFLLSGIIECVYLYQQDNRLGQLAALIYIIVMGTVLFFVVIYLIFVILLLYGLHMNKPRFISAYMSCSYIYIVLAMVWCFLMALLTFPYLEAYTINLTYIGVSMYFYVVLRSYYWKLNDRILSKEKSKAALENI